MGSVRHYEDEGSRFRVVRTGGSPDEDCLMIVYVWTNLVDGKQYVGSCSRGNDREKFHLYHISMDKCPDECTSPFHRAARLYGIENFSYEVIAFGFGSVEALRKEEYRQIEERDCVVPKGYNLLSAEFTGSFSSSAYEHILDYLPCRRLEEVEGVEDV